MVGTQFDFDLFSQIVLQNAANGLTLSESGLNKDQLIVALLAVGQHLRQPEIVVTGLNSNQLRARLKTLLDKLPCDPEGPHPIASQLPDVLRSM